MMKRRNGKSKLLKEDKKQTSLLSFSLPKHKPNEVKVNRELEVQSVTPELKQASGKRRLCPFYKKIPGT